MFGVLFWGKQRDLSFCSTAGHIPNLCRLAQAAILLELYRKAFLTPVLISGLAEPDIGVQQVSLCYTGKDLSSS